MQACQSSGMPLEWIAHWPVREWGRRLAREEIHGRDGCPTPVIHSKCAQSSAKRETFLALASCLL